MNIAKKDYEQFKQDTKSGLAEIRKNQANILSCLKAISVCENALHEQITSIEESIRILTDSVKSDTKKMVSLSNTIKKLLLTLKKIEQNTETNFRNLSDAVNMIMVQGILDRIEMIGVLPKAPPQNQKAKKGHTPKSNVVQYSKVCPLCGALIMKQDNECVHCGHNFNS